jgi:hypothetical protein
MFFSVLDRIISINANSGNEITPHETIDDCFLFGKLHSPTKCIACAPIADNDSNDTMIHSAIIHAIHVFIVILFLRVKSV